MLVSLVAFCDSQDSAHLVLFQSVNFGFRLSARSAELQAVVLILR